MNTTSVILSAVAVAVTCHGSAAAQCDFNAVAKGKGMTTSLVRAFAGCPSTPSHPFVNSSTGTGVPACAYAWPAALDGETTPYVLDPATGFCGLKTRVAIEKDCSALLDADGSGLGLRAGPCHVTSIRAKCKGILRLDTTPIDGAQDEGWMLSMIARASFDDPEGGDMTVVDLPLWLPFGTPSKGRIALDGNSAQALADLLVGSADAALPTCTTMAITRVRLHDPEGLPFAVLGTATRAKDE